MSSEYSGVLLTTAAYEAAKQQGYTTVGLHYQTLLDVAQRATTGGPEITEMALRRRYDFVVRVAGRPEPGNPQHKKAAPDEVYHHGSLRNDQHRTVRREAMNASRTVIEMVIGPGFDTSRAAQSAAYSLQAPERRRDAIRAGLHGVGAFAIMWGGIIGATLVSKQYGEAAGAITAGAGLMAGMGYGFGALFLKERRNRHRTRLAQSVAGRAILQTVGPRPDESGRANGS